jgi:prepilin-type processing-associated H-X9-DG protein
MSAGEKLPKRMTAEVGIVIVMVGAAIVLLSAVLYPVFTPRDRRYAPQLACMSNQRQIMLAMLTYAGDYDGRLPPASHWNTFLVTYLKGPRAKRDQVFRCPSARHDGGAGYDYAFSPLLTGKDIFELPEATLTVAMFDAESGHLALRHREGANIAYADGHVKWSRPTRTPAGWVIEGPNRKIPVPVGAQAAPAAR